MSSRPLNEIESIPRRIGHIRDVSKIGTAQDCAIEFRPGPYSALHSGVEFVHNKVEMYRRPMSLAASVDPPTSDPKGVPERTSVLRAPSSPSRCSSRSASELGHRRRSPRPNRRHDVDRYSNRCHEFSSQAALSRRAIHISIVPGHIFWPAAKSSCRSARSHVSH